MSDSAEVLAGEREAQAFLLALRSWPAVGGELETALLRVTGERRAGFLRRIQSELLAQGQRKTAAQGGRKMKAKRPCILDRKRVF